jgi:general secretion pathway protein G
MEKVTGKKIRRRSRKLEGMTLVEIMVVVIIMTLIASAVGVAVFQQKKKADIKDTKMGAAAVSSAATLWVSEHAGQCPSVQQLIDDGDLDGHKRTKDAWDNDFTIECDDSGISVKSAGPDKQMGTEDDITG